jgi:hypothetical protein
MEEEKDRKPISLYKLMKLNPQRYHSIFSMDIFHPKLEWSPILCAGQLIAFKYLNVQNHMVQIVILFQWNISIDIYLNEQKIIDYLDIENIK